MENLSVETLDCITSHMQAFLSQSGEQMADFGEPCSGCPHVKTCDFDWFGKMQPIFDRSNVKFKLIC